MRLWVSGGVPCSEGCRKPAVWARANVADRRLPRARFDPIVSASWLRAPSVGPGRGGRPVQLRERAVLGVRKKASGRLCCEYQGRYETWQVELSELVFHSTHERKDGRWREQAARLFASGHRVIYVFEGDFRETGMYASLVGAWISSELRNC